MEAIVVVTVWRYHSPTQMRVVCQEGEHVEHGENGTSSAASGLSQRITGITGAPYLSGEINQPRAASSSIWED